MAVEISVRSISVLLWTLRRNFRCSFGRSCSQIALPRLLSALLSSVRLQHSLRGWQSRSVVEGAFQDAASPLWD